MKFMSKHFTSKTHEQLVLEPEDWTKEQYDAFLQVFGLKEAERIVIHEYKIEAWGSEITEKDWDEAYKHLCVICMEFINPGYTLGPFSNLAVNAILAPLMKRYRAGERTKNLYDNIMGLTENRLYLSKKF